MSAFWAMPHHYSSPVDADISLDVATIVTTAEDGKDVPALTVVKNGAMKNDFTSLDFAKDIAKLLNKEPVSGELSNILSKVEMHQYGCEITTSCGSVSITVNQGLEG